MAKNGEKATVIGGILYHLEKNLSNQERIDLFNHIQELMNYGRNHFTDQLDRTKTQTKNSKGDEGNNGRIHKYYFWVCLLHSVYKISLKDLGLDEKDPLYKAINNNETKEFSNQIIQLDGFSGTKTEKGNASILYFEKSKELLSHVDSSLWVYDYLERHYAKNREQVKEYIGVQRKLFKVIEATLVDECEYVRLLGLPMGVEEVDQAKEDKELLKKAVIKYCSVPLYEHIFRTLSKHPEFEYRGTRSGFYMIAMSPRNYHFAVINGGEKSMSEYFRYNEFGFCKPDIMFIDELDTQFKNKSDIYNMEFKKSLARCDKFTMKDRDCEELLEELIEETQEKINGFNPQKMLVREKEELEALLKSLGRKKLIHSKN